MKRFFTILIICIPFLSCNKIRQFSQDPELSPVTEGLQISASLGYAASVAIAAFNGEPLPSNVKMVAGSPGEFTSAGVITVTINNTTPLPFSAKTGQMIIAGFWDGNGGVFSVAFTDIQLTAGESRFYGFYTIPIAFSNRNNKYIAVFAEQDVVLGEGSDTLLSFNLTRAQFNTEIARVDETQPNDMFVAISQNVWFVNIDRNNNSTELYDDTYTFYGGGQIAEVRSSTGGILYHAILGAEVRLNECIQNPVHGDAFIQNFKAGEEIDLGTIVLNFRSECSGRAFINNATGRYFRSSKEYTTLNLK